MSNKLQHVPEALKHTADAATGMGLVATWIASLTPLLNFFVVILALIWGYFRIQDMRLSIKIKKMKIRRHEDT